MEFPHSSVRTFERTDVQEATDKVHNFFETDYFTNIEPIEGACEALESLKDEVLPFRMMRMPA